MRSHAEINHAKIMPGVDVGERDQPNALSDKHESVPGLNVMINGISVTCADWRGLSLSGWL